MIEETIIPYELPEVENHSFFFVDVHIDYRMEAKLHRHEAWELYYVIQGNGNRMAGDTLQSFSSGDIVLIPPSMHHRWEYNPSSADNDGCVHYLMVAFSNSFVMRCMDAFPELRNSLSGISLPTNAFKFGKRSSVIISQTLSKMNGMNDLERLCEMFKLLPTVFTASDLIFSGKPINMERDVRRMQQISTYVMAHYVHNISLDDISTEIGMNRSAFCTYFKHLKGITFSQFVTQYRLNTACSLLKESHKHISEICFMVGFNDLPHFVRVFTNVVGMSPSKYRKQFKNS